ncbi:MAG: baseplate J/gp47 family protein, partial [Sulfuricaulis sp.]|nr:baseplate J/gp47 family protein [Sulfuricaulis sp.]
MTRDARVRREAAALGMPVFESAGAAQRGVWPQVDVASSNLRRRERVTGADLRAKLSGARVREAAWQSIPALRIGLFAVGVLAVLSLVGAFLPSATITLSPPSQTQSLIIPVEADPTLKSVFITGGVPARETNVEVAGSQTIPTTGESAVPESEAKGVARFKNLTSAAVQISVGTVVRTLGESPIRFVITEAGEIPAGLNKTVDLPMAALGAGAKGNLGEGLVQSVEGPLGLLVTVTNPAPTSGGTEHSVAAPSAEDRERLRAVLLGTLRLQAQEEMLAALPTGSVVFPSTLVDMQILEEAFDPPAGASGATLLLTMRVKFRAQYASGDDLAELARLSADAAIQNTFVPVPESLSFELQGIPSTAEDGRTAFNLLVTQRTLPARNVTQIIALTQGRRRDSALARLTQLLASDSPRVELNP